MERINHHHLFIFWNLAKYGTFIRTAEELSIAQSAVTLQIKNLENILGLELIDRSNKRKPLITEAGRKVLEYADSIFETSFELLKWAKQGELAKKQVLRVGALSGLSRNFQFQFLKPIIGSSHIKIEITTGDQDKLVKLLREHSLDLILSSHNISIEGKSTFHAHVLTKSPLVFVSNSKFKKGLTLRQALQNKSLYIPGHNFEARPELDAYFEKLKITPKIFGEIDDVALLRIFALRSGQVVVLPLMGVIDDVIAKNLCVLGNAGQIEQRFYAITRQRIFPHPIVGQLIEKIKK
ncbi:MAG: LysR family transcriptional regulator [Pseudobdellovibrionaceae bacterium]